MSVRWPDRVRVGLAGFGNVGQDLAGRLVGGAVPGVSLVAAAARDLDKARHAARAVDPLPPMVPLADLAPLCDVVVECATADSFPEIARSLSP